MSCRALLLTAGLVLALGACSSSPELTEEQKALRDSIVLVDRTERGGVRYAVNEKPGVPGLFEVRTVDRRAGNPNDIRAAVIREYGCTSIEVISHNRNWSDAEVKGAFCKGGRRAYRY